MSHATGDERLESNQQWMRNAALRLSRMYGVDREDAYQALAIWILGGRSRRIAWLKARQSIEAEQGCGDNSISQTLRDFGSGEIELITRMMDLEIILTPSELEIVRQRVEGRTSREVSEALGISDVEVCRELKVIRKKIKAYYAS